MWYTNWLVQSGGVLVKFKQDEYFELGTSEELPLIDFVDVVQLPIGLNTPNGLSIGTDGMIWIAETSSSFFFSVDPVTKEFTKYITSAPHELTFGNSTGIIKFPISRPYWTGIDDAGKVVFNEQTGNRIGIFDPIDESLVEYMIPSKNPNWGDCGLIDDCGLAQIFDFTIQGDKIWFTEWVENNIGVLDTSIPLPHKVILDTQQITMRKGTQTQVNLTITPVSSDNFTTLPGSKFVNW